MLGHRAGPLACGRLCAARATRFAGGRRRSRNFRLLCPRHQQCQSNRYRGEFMATATSTAQPSRDDFAKMLEESFAQGSPQEGAVVKGIVVGIEKDLAVIDVGAKTEGRVALREFAGPGRPAEIKVGDTVEVYLERVENALGEAVLSRDKARREESWGKLEKAFNSNEKVQGVIFNQVKGGFTVDLDGAVAFLPRSQVDIRPIRDVSPLMNQ